MTSQPQKVDDIEGLIHIANVVMPQQLRAVVQECVQKDDAFAAWKAFYLNGDEARLKQNIRELTVLPSISAATVAVTIDTAEPKDQPLQKGIKGVFSRLNKFQEKAGMSVFLLMASKLDKAEIPEGLNARQARVFNTMVQIRKYWADPARNPSETFRSSLQQAVARKLGKSRSMMCDMAGFPLIKSDDAAWDQIRRELNGEAAPKAKRGGSKRTPKAP